MKTSQNRLRRMKLDYPTEIHPFTNRWFNFNEPTLTDEAKSAWVINEEKQYFGFLPNRQIKHLIVGSFPIWQSVHSDPPQDGFDFAFFYCSRANGFFKILEALTGNDFFMNGRLNAPHEKVCSITDFFLRHELGITDILWEISRTGENSRGADDASIKAVLFNNLLRILQDYQEITHLYFTSVRVHTWFRDHLRQATGLGQIRGNFYLKNLGRKVLPCEITSPSKMANVRIAGNLNEDDRLYNEKDSLRKHMLKIPFVLNMPDEKDRYRVVQWAKHLKNVPDLVRLEILNHPSFMAIEDRL